MWNADGAGIVEVAFLCWEEAFVGVDDLAGEGGEGDVGDSFGEAGEGFEDGFVGDGLTDEAGGPAGEIFGWACVASSDSFGEGFRVDEFGMSGGSWEWVGEFGFDVVSLMGQSLELLRVCQAFELYPRRNLSIAARTVCSEGRGGCGGLAGW